MEENEQEVNPYLRGRGAQFNTPNRFIKTTRVRDDVESIDELVRRAIGPHRTIAKHRLQQHDIDAEEDGA